MAEEKPIATQEFRRPTRAPIPAPKDHTMHSANGSTMTMTIDSVREDDRTDMRAPDLDLSAGHDHREPEFQSLRQEARQDLKAEFLTYLAGHPLRDSLSAEDLAEGWVAGLDPWSMPVNIIITGVANAYQDGRLLEDPDDLRDLDGLLCDEAPFTDLLGSEGIEGQLSAALESGGQRQFHYVEGSEGLAVTTEYRASHPLKGKELSALGRFTLDQWADDIEEDYWARSRRLLDLRMECHWLRPKEAEELGYPSIEMIPDLPCICNDCRRKQRGY
jgi:hypothetical protein